MKKIIITIIVLAVLIGGYFAFRPTSKPVSLGDVNNNPINRPMTSGGVLCGTTSTLLLATSTSGRNFATITNIGTTIVYLGFGYSAANYQGTALAVSGGTITLDSSKSYQGAIYCISPTAASTTYSDSNS
jgi:hypothetical protein